MPFGTPPSGGPLSRTRTRLSASSLTKYLRCEKQFFLSNKLGLSSPKSIPQMLGIVIEDSLCSILMRRPVGINSLSGLRDWCFALADDEAVRCFQERQEQNGIKFLWRREDSDWHDVELGELSRKIKNGLVLFLEEVENCFNDNGGPYLEVFRDNKQPYDIPSPAWGEETDFPISDKVRNFGLRSWAEDEPFDWEAQGKPVTTV